MLDGLFGPYHIFVIDTNIVVSDIVYSVKNNRSSILNKVANRNSILYAPTSIVEELDNAHLIRHSKTFGLSAEELRYNLVNNIGQSIRVFNESSRLPKSTKYNAVASIDEDDVDFANLAEFLGAPVLSHDKSLLKPGVSIANPKYGESVGIAKDLLIETKSDMAEIIGGISLLVEFAHLIGITIYHGVKTPGKVVDKLQKIGDEISLMDAKIYAPVRESVDAYSKNINHVLLSELDKREEEFSPTSIESAIVGLLSRYRKPSLIRDIRSEAQERGWFMPRNMRNLMETSKYIIKNEYCYEVNYTLLSEMLSEKS